MGKKRADMTPEEVEKWRAYDRARSKTDPRRSYAARKPYAAAYNRRPENKARMQAWRDANRDTLKTYWSERRAKDPRLMLRYSIAKYNLTLEQYDAKVIEQCGKCAICLEPPENGRFYIDHDQRCCKRVGSCGKCLRALLCTQCNTMLGLAKENLRTLHNAILYLQHHLSFSG